jgi:hypothetical protein
MGMKVSEKVSSIQHNIFGASRKFSWKFKEISLGKEEMWI